VLLFLIIGAVAALMIGYDLARTAFAPAKKPATAQAPTTPAKPSEPSVSTSTPPENPQRTRLSGPVVVFQMLDYRGGSHSGAAAQKALARVPWFSGIVVVDHKAREIVVGVRGGSINSNEAKQALEAAGFKIGSTAFRSGGS
jgi:hypothetical protein